jgi:hypothetical protein
MDVGGVSIPWYQEHNFEALRALFTDGEDLHDTFAEWLEAAEAVEARLHGEGVHTVRIILEPEAFAAWCAAQQRPPDARARQIYASELAHLQHGQPIFEDDFIPND